MSSIKNLEKRVATLKKSLSEMAANRRGLNCNCRKNTDIHCADEFEAIAAVPCPVHGVRAMGFVMKRSSWLPLDKELRQFCHCPPDLHREYVEGKRPLPTEEEKSEERRRRNEQDRLISPEESRRALKKEKAKFDAAYSQYQKNLEEQSERLRKAELAKYTTKKPDR